VRALALLRATLLSGIIGLVGLAVYSYRHAIDHGRAVAYARDLRQLKLLDQRLNETLLESRSGLVAHYDALVRNVIDLGQLLRALEKVPEFLKDTEAADLRRKLERANRLAYDKGDLVESFKSHNAVLRNSQRFLRKEAWPARDRVALTPGIALELDALRSSLMLLDVANDGGVHRKLASAIDRLAALVASSGSAGLDQDLGIVVRHARVVAGRKPIVDDLVLRTLSVPLGELAVELEESYTACHSRALEASSARQRALLGVAMIVITLGLTEVILRLRRGRSALEKATAELIVANRALAKEREKERELGEMKTRFVAMASHEFRTPLSAILSSGELLERYGKRWDEHRRGAHLERILSAARGMNELLGEILMIGRGESGLLRPAPAPVNLDELCDEVILTLASACGGRHTIRRSLSGDANVVIDERLAWHLLSNLLENALKYSPDDSEIELAVAVDDTRILLRIRDHGIGIPAEDLPFLFTSFRRGGNVGEVKGSGLGLALVKHVVDAQDGAIEVRSAVGEGTEFVVALPRGDAKLEAPRAEAS
jgi:signal transduction histidine kinase